MTHQDRRTQIEETGWHLKKEIQFGHIVTTHLIAVPKVEGITPVTAALSFSVKF